MYEYLLMINKYVVTRTHHTQQDKLFWIYN